MKICYLVDFNSVRYDGLEGCDALDSTDDLLVFCSEKPRLSFINTAGKTRFYPAGDGQAAVFQFTTVLGYLIGKGKKHRKTRFILISREEWAGQLVRIWAERGFRIQQEGSILDTLPAPEGR